jgi:hypothetical protein
VTDLVLIYESVTSSASVASWLALHGWTLNYWTAFWILLWLTNHLKLTKGEWRTKNYFLIWVWVFNLMWRPTVSRPVCLGIKYPSGAYDQILLLSDSCDFDVALWQEDGPVRYNCCWPSLGQVFSGSSPVEHEIIFYSLRFETSLFVASYDSQGYGGGIRTRLHMGLYYHFVINYVSLIYNFGKTEQRATQITVPLSLRAYSLPWKCAQRHVTHQQLHFCYLRT